MDWGVLVVIGVAAWIVAAVFIGLVIGRMIRYRDGHVRPTPPVAPIPAVSPRPAAPAARPAPRPAVAASTSPTEPAERRGQSANI